MLAVLQTLVFEHDLRLVLLAGFVCALASFAGITLTYHARRTEGRARAAWVAVAAVSFGFGIWSTHFVAMLAFRPDMPMGYDLGLSALSLLIAIAMMGIGLWVVSSAERRSDFALGGAIAGLSIGAMHYVGMASLVIGGKIAWDTNLVTASLLLGMVFGCASTLLLSWRTARRWRAGAAGVFTLAIVAMHFTGMGAADLSNCFSIVGEGDVSPAYLSIAVALASILIIGLALGGLMLDMRERRRTAREAQRMRALANAAVEGLIVVGERRVITANASFRQLTGSLHELAGEPLDQFFMPAAIAELFAHPNVPQELQLRGGGDRLLPVEAVLRPIEFEGETRHAIAVRDLTARKKDEQQIRYLAHHDPLTGLANRASFNRALENEIAQARRLGRSFAVLCLDLDRFKEVNDLYGHGAGDMMLQTVGECLGGVLDHGQTSARLGGDEFAVIVPEAGGPAHAERVAEAILDSFRRRNGESSGALLSASIGIALYPDDAETAETLVSNADTALYRAKQDGRGIYRFFEIEMGTAVRERRLLESDLRGAIARDELSLVYQPQVSIETGAVSGFEALVRWSHPARGEVPPSVFIPIAEESDLIIAIGDWVLRRACADAAGWRNPLTVAVNVSGVQLHARDFASKVRGTLNDAGLAPRQLEIEITETALVRDMTRAIAALAQIKALGVRVAMDDFGTGYSSLANLRAFPFDKIKVDQSFIRSVDRSDQSAAIVRAVLGLGSGLNLPVVAEGVERAEELEFLRRETCAEAQGYLLARPQPIANFAAIINGNDKAVTETVQNARLSVAV